MLWSPRPAKVARVDQRAAKVAGVAAVPTTDRHATRRGSNPLNAHRTDREAVIVWRELFKLAGLDYGRAKGLTWHTIRHEFVSRNIEPTGYPVATCTRANRG